MEREWLHGPRARMAPSASTRAGPRAPRGTRKASASSRTAGTPALSHTWRRRPTARGRTARGGGSTADGALERAGCPPPPSLLLPLPVSLLYALERAGWVEPPRGPRAPTSRVPRTRGLWASWQRCLGSAGRGARGQAWGGRDVSGWYGRRDETCPISTGGRGGGSAGRGARGQACHSQRTSERSDSSAPTCAARRRAQRAAQLRGGAPAGAGLARRAGAGEAGEERTEAAQWFHGSMVPRLNGSTGGGGTRV